MPNSLTTNTIQAPTGAPLLNPIGDPPGTPQPQATKPPTKGDIAVMVPSLAEKVSGNRADRAMQSVFIPGDTSRTPNFGSVPTRVLAWNNQHLFVQRSDGQRVCAPVYPVSAYVDRQTGCEVIIPASLRAGDPSHAAEAETTLAEFTVNIANRLMCYCVGKNIVRSVFPDRHVYDLSNNGLVSANHGKWMYRKHTAGNELAPYAVMMLLEGKKKTYVVQHANNLANEAERNVTDKQALLSYLKGNGGSFEPFVVELYGQTRAETIRMLAELKAENQQDSPDKIELHGRTRAEELRKMANLLKDTRGESPATARQEAEYPREFPAETQQERVHLQELLAKIKTLLEEDSQVPQRTVLLVTDDRARLIDDISIDHRGDVMITFRDAYTGAQRIIRNHEGFWQDKVSSILSARTENNNASAGSHPPGQSSENADKLHGRSDYLVYMVPRRREAVVPERSIEYIRAFEQAAKATPGNYQNA